MERDTKCFAIVAHGKQWLAAICCVDIVSKLLAIPAYPLESVTLANQCNDIAKCQLRNVTRTVWRSVRLHAGFVLFL